MAERLKAVDCKSIDKFYVGSNPTFFINIYILKMKRKVKKKDIFFGLIIRTAKESINEDGSYSKFKKNSITLLNKKKRLFTTKIIGPVSKKLRTNEYKKIYFQLKSFLI